MLERFLPRPARLVACAVAVGLAATHPTSAEGQAVVGTGRDRAAAVSAPTAAATRAAIAAARRTTRAPVIDGRATTPRGPTRR
jgi:DNA-binding transcriptional regulator LsrR (DeoR family)